MTILKGLKPYKNRVLVPGKKVSVYRNLHNGLLSIKQRGLVIGHIEAITLTQVKFKVSLKGHARVIEMKKKNVHALATGYPVAEGTPGEQTENIRYNPYTAPYFRGSNEQRVDQVRELYINANGKMIAQT